jgi:hypothetical protein
MGRKAKGRLFPVLDAVIRFETATQKGKGEIMPTSITVCELIEMLRRFPQDAKVYPQGNFIIVQVHSDKPPITFLVNCPDSELWWLPKGCD